MKLTPAQAKILNEALLGAYSYQSLERMLFFQLGKHLQHIAPPDNLQQVIFKVISTAELEGWTAELVRAAHQEQPRQPQLRQFVADLFPELLIAQGDNDRPGITLFPSGQTESTATGAPHTPAPTAGDNLHLPQLARQISDLFSEEELRDLCYWLAIDYENLPGKGKSAQARELVQYCQRHSKILELRQRCHELRPNNTW